MSCTSCVGAVAKADQLQNALNQTERDLKRAREREAELAHLTTVLERQLREALDELRLRRSATGYLPLLDNPE